VLANGEQRIIGLSKTQKNPKTKYPKQKNKFLKNILISDLVFEIEIEVVLEIEIEMEIVMVLVLVMVIVIVIGVDLVEST